MNRRIPNGTYGGVRGRELVAPSYSILVRDLFREYANVFAASFISPGGRVAC